jgi:NADH-quinone oxidoreductase subunit N
MFINKSDEPIPAFKSDGYTRLGLILSALGIVVVGLLSFVYEYFHVLSIGLR